MEPAELAISDYERVVGPQAIEELRDLAESLRGKRVIHINATPVGGGVAEILKSEIPLLRSLGIDAEWWALEATDEFFAITKRMHNGLQSADVGFSEADWKIYHDQQEVNARDLPEADLVVVHDPQPMAIAGFSSGKADAWIWRLHVDSSRPNAELWSHLSPQLEPYALAVFTLDQFAPPDVRPEMRRFVAPAIDPLTSKNRPIPISKALERVDSIGINTNRPLLSQVARLDIWKDPWGVIDAYRLVKQDIPRVQLALLGVIAAQDDPEAYGVFAEVNEYADGDPDIHIFVDPSIIGEQEVAAVQTVSQVVFQKSIQEGFGLSVTEALWKATPVIGGRAGGIPLQIQPGIGGHLVEGAEEAAGRTIDLLVDPPEARELGVNGRVHVRDNFLITRLIRDELNLYREALGIQS
ncbi:MAG: glycosyltransferase [Thermomicrobiales bacterium]